VATAPNGVQFSSPAAQTFTVFNILDFVPRYAPVRGGSRLIVSGQAFPVPATLGGPPAVVTLLVDGVPLNASVVSLARDQLVVLTPAVGLGGGVSADRLSISLQFQPHAPVPFNPTPSLSRMLFYGAWSGSLMMLS
jgi:hypothetical protein